MIGTACLVVAILVPLQWIATAPPGNPEFVFAHSIEANTQMTPEVGSILRRACLDCHSNQAPVAWV